MTRILWGKNFVQQEGGARFLRRDLWRGLRFILFVLLAVTSSRVSQAAQSKQAYQILVYPFYVDTHIEKKIAEGLEGGLAEALVRHGNTVAPSAALAQLSMDSKKTNRNPRQQLGTALAAGRALDSQYVVTAILSVKRGKKGKVLSKIYLVDVTKRKTVAAFKIALHSKQKWVDAVAGGLEKYLPPAPVEKVLNEKPIASEDSQVSEVSHRERKPDGKPSIFVYSFFPRQKNQKGKSAELTEALVELLEKKGHVIAGPRQRAQNGHPDLYGETFKKHVERAIAAANISQIQTVIVVAVDTQTSGEAFLSGIVIGAGQKRVAKFSVSTATSDFPWPEKVYNEIRSVLPEPSGHREQGEETEGKVVSVTPKVRREITNHEGSLVPKAEEHAVETAKQEVTLAPLYTDIVAMGLVGASAIFLLGGGISGGLAFVNASSLGSTDARDIAQRNNARDSAFTGAIVADGFYGTSLVMAIMSGAYIALRQFEIIKPLDLSTPGSDKSVGES